MDCVMIIGLLSEYHDGLLREPEKTLIREHLIGCLVCKGVYDDLELIVFTAMELRHDENSAFAEEKVWRRLRFNEKDTSKADMPKG